MFVDVEVLRMLIGVVRARKCSVVLSFEGLVGSGWGNVFENRMSVPVLAGAGNWSNL
jgi:hypothetical protein